MKKDYAEAFRNYVLSTGDYTLLSEYIGSLEKVQIQHNTCGHIWEVRPNDFKNNITRCPKCFGSQAQSNSKARVAFNEYMLNEAKDYTLLSDYKTNKEKIQMQHNICGNIWEVRPDHFKQGHRCPKCYGSSAQSNSKAKLAFSEYMLNEASDYTLLSEYSTALEKVQMQHNTCGHTWEVTPNSFKNHGTRCPQCSLNKLYSQAAINWLNELADLMGVEIQHAENGSEFNIPGTRYKADGYSKELNIVFEFHGNKFHGGLVGSKILPNPFTKENGEDCFDRTIKRMCEIENLGYNIFYIFESDLTDSYIGDWFKHPWA